jgi:hypothetical protein
MVKGIGAVAGVNTEPEISLLPVAVAVITTPELVALVDTVTRMDMFRLLPAGMETGEDAVANRPV